MPVDQVIRHINEQRDRYVEELFEFLRMPSVSAVPDHKEDVVRAAEFLVEQFRSLGFRSELEETAGHPVVYAESEVQADAPTLLVYGHYDVQPPDPLEEWRHPPFEPTVEGENVVARGATDDKGQLFTHVKSAEAFVKTDGRVPVNLKYVIEGEEELGSVNLGAYLDERQDGLAADYAVVSDTSQFAKGIPAITYGLKGLAYLQINLRGSSHDLHSGSFGGTVANPGNVLAQVIAKLRDETGKVTIPGFYDDVVPLEDWEREELAKLGFDEEEYRASIASPELAGESGYTALERRWARPTLDVNGLWGGYAGEGAKTIIPATAGAKISMRLVPDQDPDRIAARFREYVTEICPASVELEIETMAGARASLTPTDSPGMRAARTAIEKAFGRAPVMIREGGTIPVVGLLKEKLGIDSLMVGWGQPDDGTHSPNEKFSLTDFHRGILASAYLMDEMAQEGAG